MGEFSSKPKGRRRFVGKRWDYVLFEVDRLYTF
jgi:hypothetical protein